MDKDEAETSIWVNNGGLLTSWLLRTITEDVLAMLEETESACKIWKSLEDLLLTMTKENEIHLNEALFNLKKGNQSMDEYLKKFKKYCDKLAAMKKPLDDTAKVFHLSRGSGAKYKEFRIAMLSKPPYPTYNQFILSLKPYDQQLLSEEEEEKSIGSNHNQAYYSQRGRFKGGGRQFSSKGRGFYHIKPHNNQPHCNFNKAIHVMYLKETTVIQISMEEIHNKR